MVVLAGQAEQSLPRCRVVNAADVRMRWLGHQLSVDFTVSHRPRHGGQHLPNPPAPPALWATPGFVLSAWRYVIVLPEGRVEQSEQSGRQEAQGNAACSGRHGCS